MNQEQKIVAAVSAATFLAVRHIAKRTIEEMLPCPEELTKQDKAIIELSADSYGIAAAGCVGLGYIYVTAFTKILGNMPKTI